MKLLFLVMLLVVAAFSAVADTSQHDVPVAKFGIPDFSSEACVLCQYVVQRIENALVLRLDALDKRDGVNGAGASFVSTSDPFATPNGPSKAADGFAGSAAEIKGVVSALGSSNPATNDLAFEPSIAYKKQLLKSLRSRWGGSAMLKTISEDFMTDFCSQSNLPQLYTPFCSMMKEQAKEILKLMFFGYPTEQVCLMSKMCGRDSYMSSPTAVHDPVMSMYLNNKRGLDGMEGGIHGVTATDMKKIAHDQKRALRKAKASAKRAAKKARRAAKEAERKRKQTEAEAANKVIDAKELAELKKIRAERRQRKNFLKAQEKREKDILAIQKAAAVAAAKAGAQAASAAASADKYARGELKVWDERHKNAELRRRYNPQSIEDVNPNDLPDNIKKYYLTPAGTIDVRKKAYLWDLITSGAIKLKNPSVAPQAPPSPRVFNEPEDYVKKYGEKLMNLRKTTEGRLVKERLEKLHRETKLKEELKKASGLYMSYYQALKGQLSARTAKALAAAAAARAAAAAFRNKVQSSGGRRRRRRRSFFRRLLGSLGGKLKGVLKGKLAGLTDKVSSKISSFADRFRGFRRW
eukprot:TRINITY_DN5821_c1_g1_i1.p1 TRINITY_DN5821_c1_g1~~TRINITY_DN5821_c1_g1_i1.p1  ORF type:complete len:579 (+),score=160.62 TRINITY_DN5821_c1_g1_i1:37-1773(+)